MIKEFWVNAYVKDLNLECIILYVVSGIPITITLTITATIIICEDEDVTPYMLFWKYYFPLHLIFYNLSNISKVSNLNYMASVWYHIFISNFMPKNKNLNSLDIYEKDFLLLLNSYLKINLPHVMF